MNRNPLSGSTSGNLSSGIRTNSKPSFLQQNNPSSSKQYSQAKNPFQIDYKGGALTTNKIDIPSIKTNKVSQTSSISPKPNTRYQDNEKVKTGIIGTGIGTGIGAGIGAGIGGQYIRDRDRARDKDRDRDRDRDIDKKTTDINSTISNTSGSKIDFSSKIKTSNDLKNNIDKGKRDQKNKEDTSKLVLPSNIQATYDDILSRNKNKIENKKWNNYRDKNYSNRYNKLKNKYYWNRGWKYRTGYWDDGNWNDGYWYYNPYLFYSYLGYPYQYPYSGYYYLEYPYLDYPITNIDQTQLDDVENKIEDVENKIEDVDNKENNSEEFNKFLLDELVRLKIRLSELEKYKQEKETVIKDKTNLEKNLINQVKSEIENLDNLEDISQEIIKFLGMEIKEETETEKILTNTNKSTNIIQSPKPNDLNLIENFNCRVKMEFPYFILIILIILVFVLRR
jgi:hypothetical protein